MNDYILKFYKTDTQYRYDQPAFTERHHCSYYNAVKRCEQVINCGQALYYRIEEE